MGAHSHKVEMLAEAIIHYSGYLLPGSPLNIARNPGGLKVKAGSDLPSDEQGNRIYASVLDGLQSLLHDIEIKISGKSRCKLKPEDTLTDLAAAYDKSAVEAKQWAGYLKKALGDESINARTELKRFLEN